MRLNEQGYPERERGPNGEQITICDRDTPCQANYEIMRILGTRKGYKSAWNKDGQREWLVSMHGYATIEWLTDAEVTDGDDGRKKKTLTDEPSAKTALIDRFKKDMGWASLSSELGKEFCVPADKKPKKAAPKKRAPVARKKRAAPRPRASAASRKGNPKRKPVASSATSGQAGNRKEQQKRTRQVAEGTQQREKDADDSRGVAKKPRSDGDDENSRRMFELARKAHDFNLPEHRRIIGFIEYLVSMKYKAEDHQFLRECLGNIKVAGVDASWLVDPANHVVPAGKKVIVQFYSSVCDKTLDIIGRHFRTLKDDRTPSVTALLNDDLMRRVKSYVSKLRDADLPISQALNEAIVWELLSDALIYENASKEIRAQVSHLAREKL